MGDLAIRCDGIGKRYAIGERAAQRVLAQRATDMPRTPDTYRPHATPGIYVPTTLPAVPQWAQLDTIRNIGRYVIPHFRGGARR